MGDVPRAATTSVRTTSEPSPFDDETSHHARNGLRVLFRFLFAGFSELTPTHRPFSSMNSIPAFTNPWRYQAAINAGFAFSRHAMKPMPAKPINNIAHVDASGTAGAGTEIENVSPLLSVNVAVGSTKKVEFVNI
jgi:hypothetical protein